MNGQSASQAPGQPAAGHARRVNIGSEIFVLRADVDEAVIENVAVFVDQRIRQAKGAVSGSEDKFRSAVLAALNIAGELFEVRKALEESQRKLGENETRTQELLERLATVIGRIGQ